jgi:hypothetical protein
MDKTIPILSLIVAAFAVFVGPLISMRIARRQVISSVQVANKQIIAPMRQAWINSLRDLLAELTSSTRHFFFRPGVKDQTGEAYRRLELLEHKVQLMLNPNEEDHRKLEDLIRNMIASMQGGKESAGDFMKAYVAVIKLSREVLKREWDRVKGPIEMA